MVLNCVFKGTLTQVDIIYTPNRLWPCSREEKKYVEVAGVGRFELKLSGR